MRLLPFVALLALLHLFLGMSLPGASLPGGSVMGSTASPRTGDELHECLVRWVRDYRRGTFAELLRGKGLRKYQPYVSDALLARTDKIGRPTKLLEELEILIRLARDAGRHEDGKLLLEAYLHEERKPPRQGASPSWHVRGVLRKTIGGRDCPEAIQSIFVDRLREGLRERGETVRHENEEEVQLLMPLISSFRNPAFRVLFERLATSEQMEIAVASAEALGELGSGAALPTLVKMLGRLETGADLTRVCRAIQELVQAKSPPPEERDLKYALDVALAQLQERKDWRARMALIPLTRDIRGLASVPVLISLLEEAAGSRSADAFSGTLLSVIQAALVDLTGFFAPPHEPEKWRAFWEEHKDEFQLAPPRQEPAKKGETVAGGFFGIPVTGNRVVFVLDISGSMREPAHGETVSSSPGGQASSEFTNKLGRAKHELLRAVAGLTSDVEFNVIFFESRVRPWQKRLLPATDRNKKLLEKTVEDLRPDGGTALYDGLNAALQIQTKRSRTSRYASNVDEVFLLSDGIPSPGLSEIWEPDQIVERVTEWNLGARVRIHTVFLRTVIPAGARVAVGVPELLRKAESMMRELAERNDGKFSLH